MKKIYLLFFLKNITLYSTNLISFFSGPLLWSLNKPCAVPIRSTMQFDRSSLRPDDLKQDKHFLVNPVNIKENFDSIILDKEILDQFKMIVQILKDPQKFKKIGARTPKGILLYGPPGTGKTTLARAIAKEADCKFLYLAGSEFDGPLVGDGSEKIKQIFNLAKSNAPAIIFFDEIDTIAKKRSAFESRFHSQTIQQLLVEMDGFNKDEKPIIVIATTNNLEHLDKSLLRSGRFDLHILIDLPNAVNRKKILIKNLKTIKLSKEFDEKTTNLLCDMMIDFSGADIENIVNKASLNAISRNREAVDLIDLNKAVKELKDQKDKLIKF